MNRLEYLVSSYQGNKNIIINKIILGSVEDLDIYNRDYIK